MFCLYLALPESCYCGFFIYHGAKSLVPSGILPKPTKVITAYGDLIHDNELLRNITTSYALNLEATSKRCSGRYPRFSNWLVPSF